MAKRITEEQILQINQLYYEIGVKSRVAKIVGVSASTVSKYIIPNWKPTEKRAIKKFDGNKGDVLGSKEFITGFLAAKNKQNFLWNARLLSKSEWEELILLQKEEVL